MGAWGEGPFENDSAGDALSDLFLNDQLDLFKRVKDMLEDKDPMVFRAGAELLISVLDMRFPTLVDKTLAKLEELGKDKKFLEGWKEPKKVQKSIKSQFKRLKRKVEIK